MDTAKQERLKAAGFKVGSASDFLELSSDEKEIVELMALLATEASREKFGKAISVRPDDWAATKAR